MNTVKELEIQLEEAYKAKNFSLVNDLSQKIVEAIEKANKDWFEKNSGNISEVVSAFKAIKTAEDAANAIKLAKEKFPGIVAEPTKAKGNYKWDPIMKKNRAINEDGTFIEPPVLLRGRNAGIPIKD